MINKQNGFTLIELLISVSLLSTLLFTGTYAYQLFSERWEKGYSQFDNAVQSNKNINLLYNLLRGVHPYIVKPPNGDNTKAAFLFVGYQDSLLATSRNGLFDSTYPEIFKLQVIEDSSGLFQLIYQSVSSHKFVLLNTEQTIDFSHRNILLKDFNKIRFSYLGWESIIQKTLALESTENIQPVWRTEYSGVNSQMLPVKMVVTIEKSGNEMSFIVDFDQKSMRFLSLNLESENES